MKKYAGLISIALPLGLLFALGLLSFAAFAEVSPLFWGAEINYAWKYAFFAGAGIAAFAIISLPCFKFILPKRVLWGMVIMAAAIALNLEAARSLMTFLLGSRLMEMLERNSDREVFTLLALLLGLLLIGGGLNKERQISSFTLCATAMLCALVMIAIGNPGFCLTAIILISCAVFMHCKTFAGRKAAKIIACASVPILSITAYLFANLRHIIGACEVFKENSGTFFQMPFGSITAGSRLLGASDGLGKIAIDNPAGILLASLGWVGFVPAVALSVCLIVRMFFIAHKGGSAVERLIVLYFAINLVCKLIAFFFSLPVDIGCRLPFIQFGPAMAADFLLLCCLLFRYIRPVAVEKGVRNEE